MPYPPHHEHETVAPPYAIGNGTVFGLSARFGGSSHKDDFTGNMQSIPERQGMTNSLTSNAAPPTERGRPRVQQAHVIESPSAYLRDSGLKQNKEKNPIGYYGQYKGHLERTLQRMSKEVELEEAEKRLANETNKKLDGNETRRPSDMFSSLRFFDDYQRPVSEPRSEKRFHSGLNDDRPASHMHTTLSPLTRESTSISTLAIRSPHAATVPVHEYWLEHKAVMQQELLWQREEMLREIGRADVELLAQTSMLREKAALELEYLRSESREAVDNIVKLEQTAWKAVKRRELHLFQLQTDFNEFLSTLANEFVEREFEIAARENALRQRRFQIEAWASRLHSEMMVREVNIARISREAQRDTLLLEHRQHKATATQLRNLRGAYKIGGKESNSEIPSLLGSVTIEQKEFVRMAVGTPITISGRIMPRTFYRRKLKNTKANNDSSKHETSDTNLSPNTPNVANPRPNPAATRRMDSASSDDDDDGYEEVQTDVSQLEGIPITITYFEGNGGRLSGSVCAVIGPNGAFCFDSIIFTPNSSPITSPQNNKIFSGSSHSFQISVPKSISGVVQPKQVLLSTKANCLLVPKRRFLSSITSAQQQIAALAQKLMVEAKGSAVSPNKSLSVGNVLPNELEKIINFTAGGEWQTDSLSLNGHITFHSIEPFGLFGTEIEVQLRFTTIHKNEELDSKKSDALVSKQNHTNKSSPLVATESFASSHSTVVDGYFTEKAELDETHKPEQDPLDSDGNLRTFTDGSPLDAEEEKDAQTSEGENDGNFDIIVPLKLFGTELNQFPFLVNMRSVDQCPPTWSGLIQPHVKQQKGATDRDAQQTFSRMFMKVKVPSTKYSDAFEHEFEINTLEVTSPKPFFLYDAGAIGSEVTDIFGGKSHQTVPLEMNKISAVSPNIPKADGTVVAPTQQSPSTFPVQPTPRNGHQSTILKSSRDASNNNLPTKTESIPIAGAADGHGQKHEPNAHLAFKGLSIPLHDVVIGAQISSDGNFLAVVDARGCLRLYQKKAAATKMLALSGGSPKSIAAIAAIANTPHASPDKLITEASQTLTPSAVAAIATSLANNSSNAHCFWAELQVISPPEGQPFSAVMAWSPIAKRNVKCEITTTEVSTLEQEHPSGDVDPFPTDAQIAVYHPHTQTIYCWNLNRLRRFVEVTRKSGNPVGTGTGSTPQRSSSTSSKTSTKTMTNGPLSLDLCQTVACTLALPEEYIVATTGKTLTSSPKKSEKDISTSGQNTPNRSPSRQYLDVENLPPSNQNTPRRSYSSVSMSKHFVDPQSILSEAQFVAKDTLVAVSLNGRLYSGIFSSVVSSEPERVLELHRPVSQGIGKVVTCLAAIAPPSSSNNNHPYVCLGFSDLSIMVYSVADKKVVFETSSIIHKEVKEEARNPLRYFGSSNCTDQSGTFLYFAHAYGVILLKMSYSSSGPYASSFTSTHYSSDEIAIGDPDGGFETRLFAVVPLASSVAALLYQTNDCFLVDFGHLRSNPSQFIISSSVLGEEDSSVAIQASMDFGKTVVMPQVEANSSLVLGIDAMGPLCWQIDLVKPKAA